MRYIQHDSGEETELRNSQVLGSDSPLSFDEDGRAGPLEDDVAEKVVAMHRHVTLGKRARENDVDEDEEAVDEDVQEDDADEFDAEAFVDRTPIDGVVEDLESGEYDDHLDAIEAAADRVGVQNAIDERKEYSTMPEASADDVRVEVDTHLDDSDIEGASSDQNDDGILGRVEREIDRAYEDDPSVTFGDTQHRTDLEAVLAALRIAEGRDRRGESVQSGRTSTTYETSEIANIRKRVRRLDPGDEFGHAGSVVRDTDRHVSTTTDS